MGETIITYAYAAYDDTAPRLMVGFGVTAAGCEVVGNILAVGVVLEYVECTWGIEPIAFADPLIDKTWGNSDYRHQVTGNLVEARKVLESSF